MVGKTEEEHDLRLIALMKRARERGLVFNSTKCSIKQKSITFFGNTYSAVGISPDPAKIRDLQQMPSPQNREELQKFLGLMTYLGAFIPRLSAESYLLRDLLKDGTPFIWEENHQRVYERLKELISEESILAYYDTCKAVALEVDASMKGLGACIVQDGRPVMFASKTLTKTQSNYSNIEREMLAVMYGVERFHTYLYGRRFTIVTDHKPLEIICNKPVTAAPPRLQRMLLRIQGFDYEVKYRPGEEMTVPDTLSRLPSARNSDPITMDIRVDDFNLDLINFSDAKKGELRRETMKCPVLNALMETIHQGWPENIKQLPTALRSFWSYRESLGIEDGIIFKGKQVLIPTSMQDDILRQLHVGHQGIEKTRLLARETVYWPRINEDIKGMVERCSPCQEL